MILTSCSPHSSIVFSPSHHFFIRQHSFNLLQKSVFSYRGTFLVMAKRPFTFLYLAAAACAFVASNSNVRRATGTNLFSGNEMVSIPEDLKLWKQGVPFVQVVKEMPGNLPTDMRHKYYLLRHGQSTANVARIISSARSLAYTNKHGLTAQGYDEGFDAASRLVRLLENPAKKGDRVVFVLSRLL